MTATAANRVSSGMTPTVTGPSGSDALSIGPTVSFWLLAVKPTSKAFWITTDRPKVTRSGGRISSPSIRFSTWVCSSQPIANIAGTAISVARNGFSPSSDVITRIR